MSRIAFLILAAVFVIRPTSAVADPIKLTPVQAAQELKLLKRALTELHPGLTRYVTTAQIDAEFGKASSEVIAGSDALKMYLLASRLGAFVRCGHTWTNPLNQSPAVQADLAQLPVLPIHVRLLGDRLLVIASADAGIRQNDEVLSIDGRAPAAIVADLLPYLRADGSNDGKRRSQIDSTIDGGALDRYLPLLHAPVAGRYSLRVRDPRGKVRDVLVLATTVEVREQALKAAGVTPESEQWTFVVDRDVATLTLPTFAFWRDEFEWQGFIDRSFTALRERHIERLVIDMRRNEGGDSAIGDALLAELIRTPHTIPAPRSESAYERVPYVLARYLDTWNFDFFDRTGQVVRGEGGNWLLREQPVDQVIQPVAMPYRGRVVTLTGPRMSSAGYLLARNIKASHAATLVGQATGGNLRGLNGGQLAWLTLPTSGVAVDIPLIASIAKTVQPDRGVEPDVAVTTRVEDVIAGRDPDVAASMRILRSNSHARRWTGTHLERDDATDAAARLKGEVLGQ